MMKKATPIQIIFRLTVLIVCSPSTDFRVKGQRQRELFYDLQEEVAVGQIIGDVNTDAFQGSRYSADVIRTLRFRFLNQPPCPVVIDERTGVLRTDGRVDRESVCPETTATDVQCLVRLDVAVTPMSHFAIVKVCIKVHDVNDNDPEFRPNRKVQEMMESSPVGSLILLPAAVDRDVGRYSVQDYRLVADPDSDCFELTVSQKSDQSTDVRLVLTRSLDREAVDVHRMTILALDGGIPPRTGSLEVDIIVIDANDNSPVFDYNSYEVTVVENLAAMTTVARVRAVDRDEGQNAEVLYFFSAPTLANHGDVFTVNATSGEVIVIGDVDYESTSVYRLMVSARDRGSDPVTSDTMVIVRVQDANDNPPDITINTLAASSTDVASVPEGVESDTFVAHVVVADPDSGHSGRFNCSLDSAHFRLQTTYDGEYQIVTKAPLDREHCARYGLQLVCRDGGQPSLTSISRLRVEVSDVNDNSPHFTKMEYTAELLENNYVGAVVVQVSATDRDDGANSRIVYQLMHDVADYLDIDTTLGIIRAKHSFDREVQSRLRFPVYAFDQGVPAKTGSAVVVLEILDVNDEAPRFEAESYAIRIEENQPPRTEVGILVAKDADSFPFNQFSFFIVSGSHSDAFDLDPVTGSVVTTRSLDREDRDLYRLLAVVRDDSAPQLSSTVTVTVYVLDVNDNDPRWVEPKRDRSIVTVPSRASVGFTVTRAEAVDRDAGANGQVGYALLEDTHNAGLFDVDQTSGLVTVIGDLTSFSDNTTFSLVLLASDRASSNPRNSSTVLRVAVTKTEALSFSGWPDRRDGTASAATVPRSSLVVVVALSGATGLLVVILVMVIVCVVRKSKSRRNDSSGGAVEHNKYNCRIETMKAMAALDDEAFTRTGPAPHPPQRNGLLVTFSQVPPCSGGGSDYPQKPTGLNCQQSEYPQKPTGGICQSDYPQKPTGLNCQSEYPQKPTGGICQSEVDCGCSPYSPIKQFPYPNDAYRLANGGHRWRPHHDKPVARQEQREPCSTPLEKEEEEDDDDEEEEEATEGDHLPQYHANEGIGGTTVASTSVISAKQHLEDYKNDANETNCWETSTYAKFQNNSDCNSSPIPEASIHTSVPSRILLPLQQHTAIDETD